eukprot:4636725-Amphidinium_carterae.2
MDENIEEKIRIASMGQLEVKKKRKVLVYESNDDPVADAYELSNNSAILMRNILDLMNSAFQKKMLIISLPTSRILSPEESLMEIFMNYTKEHFRVSFANLDMTLNNMEHIFVKILMVSVRVTSKVRRESMLIPIRKVIKILER